MDMKYRGAVIHRPLPGAPYGLGAHHGADARIPEVFVIAHRLIGARQNEELIMRRGHARRDEADTLMSKWMRTAEDQCGSS